MKKLDKVIDLIQNLKNTEFTGFIKINYSQGGITKIEKTEEILNKAQVQK